MNILFDSNLPSRTSYERIKAWQAWYAANASYHSEIVVGEKDNLDQMGRYIGKGLEYDSLHITKEGKLFTVANHDNGELYAKEWKA